MSAPQRPVAPDDVAAMARYYGVDPVAEPGLLWIVREALQTPLPPNWREEPAAREGDEPAYVNTETGEWFAQHPADGYYEKLLQSERERASTSLPPDAEASAWLDFFREDGTVYYYDFVSGEEASQRPRDLIVPAPLLSDSVDEAPPGSAFGAGDSSFGLSQSRSQSQSRDRDRDRDEPLGVLHFTSWWNQASPNGLQRRTMNLYFELESGSCQVVLDQSDRVYSISHLDGKHGPVSAWDLHVGMQVDVLGRKTTLMQADLLTLEWLAFHEQQLLKLKRRLIKELRKYAPQRMAAYLKGTHEFESGGGGSKFRSSHRRGARSLRGLRGQVKQLKTMIAEYRPALAEELAGDVPDM